MSRCPAGHDSSTFDYCDVCGIPMDAAPPGEPAPPVPSSPTPEPEPTARPENSAPALQTCPHCRAANPETNLFCEVCGFDFTTGVMPRVEGGEPSFLAAVPPATTDNPGVDADAGPVASSLDVPAADDAQPGPAAPPAPAGAGSSLDLDAPVSDDRNSVDETLPETGSEGDDAGTGGDADVPAAPQGDLDPAELVPTSRHDEPSTNDAPESDDIAPRPPDKAASSGPAPAEQPSSGPAEQGDRGQEEPDPVHSAPKPVNRPPSREVAGDWVVEVWIDPDWYEVQDTDEPCPSVATPEIVRLTRSDALIGRRSRSSAPDIDCGIDSAVSRRQALLASDGRRWWIEDLDSSNGTWVGPAIGPLPSAPITSRTEVDADDRIYVGAWTRLVVRPAVESELTE